MLRARGRAGASTPNGAPLPRSWNPSQIGSCTCPANPRRPYRGRMGMRWTSGGRSDNLEDRRGEGGGGMGGLPRLGLGGIVVLVVLSLIFKRDLLTPFLSSGGAGQPNPEATAEENAAEA